MTAPGRNGSAGARASVDRLGLGQVPMILMYHGVAEVAEDPNQLSVTPGRFAEQMASLQRLGLRGVGIGTLVDAMRAGRQRGLVGITFDDGYVSVLEAAVPELSRRGFTASVFIISGRLGGTNEWDEGPAWPLLSGSQVGELAAAGIEIGSHSATHVRLAGLPPGSLKRRSARAGRVWASWWVPGSAASPIRTGPWMRPPGPRCATQATTTRAPCRPRWPSSGSWPCPGSTSASATALAD